MKIGKFGTSDTDLKYQEIIEGNIYQLADKVLEVLDRIFFISPISYEGLQRVEGWEYPYEAIRETILNATQIDFIIDAFTKSEGIPRFN